MDHLDEISVEELQDALDKIDGNKPTQHTLCGGVTKLDWARMERLPSSVAVNPGSTPEPQPPTDHRPVWRGVQVR